MHWSSAVVTRVPTAPSTGSFHRGGPSYEGPLRFFGWSSDGARWNKTLRETRCGGKPHQTQETMKAWPAGDFHPLGGHNCSRFYHS